MKNKDYQKAFSSFLTKRSHVDEASKHIGMQKEILQLYQDFVQDHYQDSLEKMFPRISDLVEFDWTEVSELYFEKYPAYAWDLNDLTKSFPEFLEGLEELYSLPSYLKELARYELMEFFVYKKTGKMSGKINPTLDIEQFHYDIASWVKELDMLEDKGEVEKMKELVPKHEINFLAVVRNPENNLCLFTKLGALEIGIIELLKEEVEQEDIYSLLQEMLPTLTQEQFDASLKLLQRQKIIF